MKINLKELRKQLNKPFRSDFVLPEGYGYKPRSFKCLFCGKRLDDKKIVKKGVGVIDYCNFTHRRKHLLALSKGSL